MDQEKTFSDAINKYFSFLVNLGFSVYEKEEYNQNAFGNGYYRFKSKSVGLEIVADRGQVLMRIGKFSQDNRDWIDWTYIIRAYAPNIKAYNFDIEIDKQVKRIGELLQQHCIELLGGDFDNAALYKSIENGIGKNFLSRFQQS